MDFIIKKKCTLSFCFIFTTFSLFVDTQNLKRKLDIFPSDLRLFIFFIYKEYNKFLYIKKKVDTAERLFKIIFHIAGIIQEIPNEMKNGVFFYWIAESTKINKNCWRERNKNTKKIKITLSKVKMVARSNFPWRLTDLKSNCILLCCCSWRTCEQMGNMYGIHPDPNWFFTGKTIFFKRYLGQRMDVSDKKKFQRLQTKLFFPYKIIMKICKRKLSELSKIRETRFVPYLKN